MPSPAEDAASQQDVAAERLLAATSLAVQRARVNPQAPPPPTLPPVVNAGIFAALIFISAGGERRTSPTTRMNKAVLQEKADAMEPEVTDRIWTSAIEHVASSLPDTDRPFARQLARSAATRVAAEATQTVGNELGFKYKVWISRGDERVRDSHRRLHGRPVEIGNPFKRWPGGGVLDFPGDPRAPMDEWINCIPSTSVVHLPGLRASMRRWYQGDLVILRFSGSDYFSSTPNHPVLRSDGRWVSAGEVMPGDHLISGTLINSVGAPHPQRPPTHAGQLHRLANMVAQAHRVGTAPPDFHGDGGYGDVDVVHIDSELWDTEDSSFSQHLSQVGFELAGGALGYRLGGGRSGVSSSPLSRSCRSRLSQDIGSSPGYVCICCERSPLDNRELCHPYLVRRATVPGSNSSFLETPSDDSPTDPKKFGEGLLTDLFIDVEMEQVVGVDVVPWHGYVSNFDTGEGWFLVDTVSRKRSLVSGNCRCTMVFSPTKAGVAEALGPGDLDKAFALAASLEVRWNEDDD